MSKPLIFISHKHADKDIAAAVAGWFQEATDYNMDVFLSSNEKFKGLRFGREINKELRSALWRCDVLILIYTMEDREWSYCMWECGVANDASSPETTMIVFQFSDDVPRVLSGTNRVDVRKKEDIRRFSEQFFTDPEFFPSLGSALKPNLPPAKIESKADELLEKLKERPDFNPRRDWSTWPYVQVELSTSDADRLQTLELSEGAQLVRERGVIGAFDPSALGLFGLANLSPSSKFQTLAAGQPASGSWFEACCEQIVVSAADRVPQIRCAPIRYGNREYVPAVTRVRKMPSEARMAFDIYFYDLPSRQAAGITERMLTLDRFFWKSLELCRPESTRLGELNRELKAQTKNRVPFLDGAKHPKYILHRSAITEFLVDHGANEDLTLKDFLGYKDLRDLIENSFVTVKPDATLADAAVLMRSVTNCSDIFVTLDGTRETPVQGWLTNRDLEQSGQGAMAR